jgi:hypothetical protein
LFRKISVRKKNKFPTPKFDTTYIRAHTHAKDKRTRRGNPHTIRSRGIPKPRGKNDFFIWWEFIILVEYLITHIMFTLDCSYYTKSFDSIDALLDDVITSGMDPNYEIMKDGEPTGETAWDLIQP